MPESRLYQGKPQNFPEPRQRRSFYRAVRAIESAMRKNRRRNENSDLIALRLFDGFETYPRRKKFRRVFLLNDNLGSVAVSTFQSEFTLQDLLQQISKTPTGFVQFVAHDRACPC